MSSSSFPSFPSFGCLSSAIFRVRVRSGPVVSVQVAYATLVTSAVLEAYGRIVLVLHPLRESISLRPQTLRYRWRIVILSDGITIQDPRTPYLTA
jgi:hypothetical protein